MAAAAILKMTLMAISWSLWLVFAQKFSQGLKTMFYKLFLPSKFTSHKIQDGGGRHFEIHVNGHNSVITALICTKFGAETKNTSRKRRYLQISLLRKSKMAAAAILKIGLKAMSRSLWHIFARNSAQ